MIHLVSITRLAPDEAAARLLLLVAWHTVGWADAVCLEPRFDLGAGPVNEDDAAHELLHHPPPVRARGTFHDDHVRLHVESLVPGSVEHLGFQRGRRNGGLAQVASGLGPERQWPGDEILVVAGDRALKLRREALEAFDRYYDDATLPLAAAGDHPDSEFAHSLGIPAEQLESVAAVMHIGRDQGEAVEFMTVAVEPPSDQPVEKPEAERGD